MRKLGTYTVGCLTKDSTKLIGLLSNELKSHRLVRHLSTFLNQ